MNTCNRRNAQAFLYGQIINRISALYQSTNVVSIIQNLLANQGFSRSTILKCKRGLINQLLGFQNLPASKLFPRSTILKCKRGLINQLLGLNYLLASKVFPRITILKCKRGLINLLLGFQYLFFYI